MEFSRPEYWRGYPLPSPGDRPNPVVEPRYLALQRDSLPAEPQGEAGGGIQKETKDRKRKTSDNLISALMSQTGVKLPSKYSHHHFPGAVSNLGLRAPEIQDTACPHNGVFLHWKLMILPVTLPVFFFYPSDICLLLKIKINVKVRTSFSLLLK